MHHGTAAAKAVAQCSKSHTKNSYWVMKQTWWYLDAQERTLKILSSMEIKIVRADRSQPGEVGERNMQARW
jgi:hypothetical protein